MTIQKNPEERKTEIIQTAKKLFSERGYKSTQVKDIVNEIGVAQGLFYYYFKSKEDVMVAVAEDYANNAIEKVKRNTQHCSKCEDMIFQIFDIFIENANKESEIFAEIQTADNGLIHEKILSVLAKRLVPIVTKIAKVGNDSGEFACQYPEQATKILVNGILGILKESTAQSRIETLTVNLKAFKYIIKKVYGTKE